MKWGNIKVSQLPEIQKLIEFKTNDAVELLDRDIALLSIVTGKSEDYLGSLKPADFGKLRAELYQFISTQPTKEFNPVIRIGGRKFSTVVTCNEVTVDQLSDVHLLQITEKNYYSKLPYILAIFAREKRNLFTFWRKPLNFTQKVELFKSLPADQANSISLFFCTVLPELEKVILASLEKQIDENLNNLNQALREQGYSGNGDGSQRFTTSQTGTSPRKRNTGK